MPCPSQPWSSLLSNSKVALQAQHCAWCCCAFCLRAAKVPSLAVLISSSFPSRFLLSSTFVAVLALACSSQNLQCPSYLEEGMALLSFSPVSMLNTQLFIKLFQIGMVLHDLLIVRASKSSYIINPGRDSNRSFSFLCTDLLSSGLTCFKSEMVSWVSFKSPYLCLLNVTLGLLLSFKRIFCLIKTLLKLKCLLWSFA